MWSPVGPNERRMYTGATGWLVAKSMVWNSVLLKETLKNKKKTQNKNDLDVAGMGLCRELQ